MSVPALARLPTSIGRAAPPMSAIRRRSTAPALVPAFDAEFVLYRLKEAGRVLMALPRNDPRLGIKTQSICTLAEAVEATTKNTRAPRERLVPSSEQISRMDRSFEWLALIAKDKRVIRRVVAMRSLCNPVTGRHCVSWRDVGKAVGASHVAVQSWHNTGIDLIVAALNHVGL